MKSLTRLNSPTMQALVAMLLVIFLVLLVCPWEVFMPTMSQMLLLTFGGLFFLVWLSFVWLESPADEREMQHRDFASRVAYVTGAFALMVAVIIQVFTHTLDVWIVGVLVLMVIAKSIARSVSEKYY